MIARRIALLLGGSAWIACSTAASAGDDSPRRDEALALSCATCHSATREADSMIPPLAGSATDLLEALLAFKRGQRQATIMDRIASGYSDDELERIAHFIAGASTPAASAR